MRRFAGAYGIFGVLCLILAGLEARAADGPAEVQIAHIDLSGSFSEQASPPGLFGDIIENFTTLTNRIEKAATDNKVQAVVLRINGAEMGRSQISALRQSIKKVQAAGKKVYGYFDAVSNRDYLLAIACDKIVCSETADLMLVGFRAEVGFYKKLLDNLGIHADALRVGEFKSAAEPFSRTAMSPEFRKEMEELLDDFYSQFVDAVAKSRKLTPEQVRAAVDQAPLIAADAKKLGLVDHIGYESDIEALVKEETKAGSVKVVQKYGKKKADTDFSGFAGLVKLMDVIAGVEPSQRKTGTAKIAVIYAQGPIMTGRSQQDLFSGDSTIGSDTMAKAIREAANDATVKAIVLRVNSPGGSATASDLIWHELKRVKKPLVVSMGDVAASGGYYISMGAERIFADPGTITGSIGVVGIKLALDGLYQKIGVSTDVISRGKNSGVLSSTTPFSETERAAMQKMMNDMYKIFTEKAAAGRKMPVTTLEPLARGRIYTGERALKLGLIDELGTLEDSIAHAKKLAGLKPEDKTERLELPKAINPFEALFGPIDISTSTTAKAAATSQLLREISPELEKHVRTLRWLERLSKEGTLTLLPFTLEVK